MPHLNEINSTYGPQGLKIVAVSDERGDVIEKRGIQPLGMTYGVARAAGASRLYGVNGIPHAFIIGKDGKVLWRGHPGYIDDGMLAAWLGGQPMPDSAPQSAEGASAASTYMKLGVFILLCGIAVFFLLRTIKPQTPPGTFLNTQAMPPQRPTAAPQVQGGPPAPSPNCSHCGTPKRDGRKNCMGCGAPI